MTEAKTRKRRILLRLLVSAECRDFPTATRSTKTLCQDRFSKKRRTQNDYEYVRRFIFRGDASRVAPLTTCDYTEER